jgi:hypothetical protein
MKPIWIPPELDQAFRNTVVQAFTKPHIYHTDYAPVPWVVGFFGRPGMEKKEVIQKLCQSYGLQSSVTHVDVKLGCVTDALNEIQSIYSASFSVKNNLMEKESSIISHIIVVDHADVLAYEPDSEKTLLACLDFKKKCEQSGVLLIGIFDRLPGETHGQTSNWVREAHNKFFSQFETLLYIECPNEAFRMELFKYYIEDFVKYYNQTHDPSTPIINNVLEDDYTRLALVSTFATPENIITFLRKVFSKMIHMDLNEGGEDSLAQKGLTVDYIEEFTNTQFGAPHICPYDACDANNAFATGCGRGPTIKKKKPVLKKPEDFTNLTGFNEENVELKSVMNNLKENAEEEGVSPKEQQEKQKKQTKRRKTKK